MQRFIASSDDLGPGLDERARLALWHQTNALAGAADVSYLTDRPFRARIEVIPVGAVTLLNCRGTFSRVTRTARHISGDRNEDFSFHFFDTGSSLWLHTRRGHALERAAGSSVLWSSTEPSDSWSKVGYGYCGAVVPRTMLLDLVANAEDLAGALLDPANAAMRHLQRYLGFLLAPGGVEDDPAVAKHVATTVVDLAALALGARGDAAALAQTRGLRAARVQEILAAIHAGFSDPACSPRALSERLRLSPRYINELLQETGTSFAERVLELRLQKARAMLGDPRHDRLKISEIAYRCGFNEVSYFNRCFRRRFGLSPTTMRGREDVRGTAR